MVYELVDAALLCYLYFKSKDKGEKLTSIEYEDGSLRKFNVKTNRNSYFIEMDATQPEIKTVTLNSNKTYGNRMAEEKRG